MGRDTMTGFPRRRHGLELRALGDEVAVHDPVADRDIVLNPTALALWELCDGLTSPQEMVEAISALFDAPPAEVERDVTRAFDEFKQAGLIDWQAPPDPEAGEE